MPASGAKLSATAKRKRRHLSALVAAMDQALSVCETVGRYACIVCRSFRLSDCCAVATDHPWSEILRELSRFLPTLALHPLLNLGLTYRPK